MEDREVQEAKKRLSQPHPCFMGQWTIHEPHEYETTIQAWLGGGKNIRQCPGKNAETVLK